MVAEISVGNKVHIISKTKTLLSPACPVELLSFSPCMTFRLVQFPRKLFHCGSFRRRSSPGRFLTAAASPRSFSEEQEVKILAKGPTITSGPWNEFFQNFEMIWGIFIILRIPRIIFSDSVDIRVVTDRAISGRCVNPRGSPTPVLCRSFVVAFFKIMRPIFFFL